MMVCIAQHTGTAQVVRTISVRGWVSSQEDLQGAIDVARDAIRENRLDDARKLLSGVTYAYADAMGKLVTRELLDLVLEMT